MCTNDKIAKLHLLDAIEMVEIGNDCYSIASFDTSKCNYNIYLNQFAVLSLNQ